MRFVPQKTLPLDFQEKELLTSELPSRRPSENNHFWIGKLNRVCIQ